MILRDITQHALQIRIWQQAVMTSVTDGRDLFASVTLLRLLLDGMQV